MIHHLNCGTLRPRYPAIESLVYCLLIESNKGLILVDTGFGDRDYSQPSLMMKVFLKLLGVPCDPSETALARVKALGYTREDVKHIVLTHLHLDHAGGLPDFPDADIHVWRREYDAMVHHQGLLSWGCDKNHFKHGPRWCLHDSEPEKWYGFDSIKVFEDCVPEVRLILLPGHTRGHCGVAVVNGTGWLLQCGDAASPLHQHTDIFDHPPVMHSFPYIPRWFARWVMGPHVNNLRILRRLHGDQIEFISGHDIYSFIKHNPPAG